MIYCCGCGCDVKARLTDGKEIYPHRADLYDLPFWKCDRCHNYVGCHHKTAQRTNPTGNIPTAEIRALRVQIHSIIDPLWKSGEISRGALYRKIGKYLGYVYHTGEIKSVKEAEKVIKFVKSL
jgi:hypothetical protein